jgi:isoquinoline 1-oxidoreductase subunit alpha
MLFDEFSEAGSLVEFAQPPGRFRRSVSQNLRPPVSHRKKSTWRQMAGTSELAGLFFAAGEPSMSVTLTLNDRTITLDLAGDTPLLWAIRENAGLTGTKYGCGIAQCGACTVHLDGRPIRSCVTPVSASAGKPVTTIEGVSGSTARAVKSAWEKLDVAQCGYCQSGQIMSAIALLNEKRNPTDAEIDAAMSGNICRCGTYARIRAAIHEAAHMKEGER